MATTSLWLAGLAIPALFAFFHALYNIFLHPLRNFPGPLLAGATSGWKAYKEVIKGETLAQELFHLHRKYGMVHRQQYCLQIPREEEPHLTSVTR
jgi:hypothetical protein